MKRTAIFIDAGYLYAQGSACLQGSKVKRENLRLDHDAFIRRVRLLATTVQPQAPLLRIYWYDGTSRGPTLDHRTLADLDDVKLRLGFINSMGQQKGVDSLLVTDVVELARNGAICDALLLGGDEDLRIGVQIAQSFGVRVHLIGIEPSRGSQSIQLRQEADTKHEISSADVKTFLSLALAPETLPLVIPLSQQLILTIAAGTMSGSENVQLDLALDQGIGSVLAKLSASEIEALARILLTTTSIPSHHDRRVLGSCRTVLGRDLTMEEKRLMRSRFIRNVRVAASSAEPISS